MELQGTHPELQVLPEVAPSFSMPPTDPPTATDESVMGVTDMQSNSFDYGHDYPETVSIAELRQLLIRRSFPSHSSGVEERFFGKFSVVIS